MELDKCSEEELLQRSKEIRERFGDGNMMELTEEDIKKLSYDDQLILAKMNYLANNYVYNLDLANNGMEVEDYTLCTFILTDDKHGFMIFKNDPDYYVRTRTADPGITCRAGRTRRMRGNRRLPCPWCRTSSRREDGRSCLPERCASKRGCGASTQA